jgi:thiosulfate/3-mercaptopyruvate sulfurtransferase
VYGDSLPGAAQAWWLLNYCGLKAKLLDGGLPAFVDAGGVPSSEETVKPAPSSFAVRFQPERFATADDVKKLGVDQRQCQILDNRTAGEFSGEDVRGKRGGHIPGANHLDWQIFVDESGRLLPDDSLKEIFLEKKIVDNQPIVTHCQSGGRSSVGALVAEIVTGKPARNYYGSWGDWSSREELPVATDSP